MKKTLTLAGLGACMLLVFPSCKSTDDDGFSGSFEEATPMSTIALGDDQLPPWLLEDTSDSGQVDAGATTLIPAPEEEMAEVGGKASSRQNQPGVAVNDDVVVDTPPAPDAGIDPLSGTAVTTDIVAPKPSTPKVTTPAQPKKGTAGTAKTGTKGSKGAKGGKTVKKVSEPTMIVYKVKKGDNLSDIAKRSRTTVAQIRKDSGIKGDLIYPGQTIKVRYTPKDYTPSKSSAKNTKNGKNTKANQKSTTKTTGGKNYTVRQGDTISGIAKKHGVSTAAVLKANNMTAADAVKIRAGKKLIIPKS